jgi:hypothetical protein
MLWGPLLLLPGAHLSPFLTIGREPVHRVTRKMEETAGSPARAEARVVSATLTWRQRPPVQEESRHRFHKVSLVSGARMEAPQDVFEHSFRREEVNGFVKKEEETVNCQGSGEEPGSTNFQSHGPIFSKKYIPPPKEKRPTVRVQEAADWGDGGPQAPRTELPGMGSMARTELLVPLPGPREPSPHPHVGVASGGSRNREEWRVTRTVRTTTTTTVVGGHVDRRVSSSVSVGPSMSGETLPRGRNVTRTVRAVVVSPRAEGSPSRSQALEVLSNLMPAERIPPASRIPRLTMLTSRGSGPGGTVGTTLGQPLEISTTELKNSISALAPVGVPAVDSPAQNIDIPVAHPIRDQGGVSDARTEESSRLQGASSVLLLNQTSQSQVPASSSPKPQTCAASLTQSPEQPVVPAHLEAQSTPHVLPAVKEKFTGLSTVPVPPTAKGEVTVPEPPPSPSSPRRKAAPSSQSPCAPASPKSKFVPDPENVPSSALTQKEVYPCPSVPAHSHIPKEVLQAHGAPKTSSSRPTTVVQNAEGGPSIKKEVGQYPQNSPSPCSVPCKETVESPTFPAPLPPKQDEVVRDSPGNFLSSPTPKGSFQSPPFAPSSSEAKESLSLEGSPASKPMGAEVSTGSQTIPDSTEGKVPSEPSEEEDEAALTADLEIFLDTLRSMEPPEILRTHRLPRAPRSSYLAMYATLPAIEEDQLGPCVPGPGPQERPVLEEEEEEVEEEEEELENPYLSDDEKLRRRQEKAGPRPSLGLHPPTPAKVTCSPMEMMKKLIAGQGPEPQPSNRPTSRLGGSLLFGNLVPANKDAPALEPLGTKLSALPPHGAPGVKKVPGQLPLLCSGRPPPEKPAPIEPPEGWVSDLVGVREDTWLPLEWLKRVMLGGRVPEGRVIRSELS